MSPTSAKAVRCPRRRSVSIDDSPSIDFYHLCSILSRKWKGKSCWNLLGGVTVLCPSLFFTFFLSIQVPPDLTIHLLFLYFMERDESDKLFPNSPYFWCRRSLFHLQEQAKIMILCIFWGEVASLKKKQIISQREKAQNDSRKPGQVAAKASIHLTWSGDHTW